jgi:hypothetical protein
MGVPTVTNIRRRESTRRQDFVYVDYSHGITTILREDNEIVLAWIDEGNTIAGAD